MPLGGYGEDSRAWHRMALHSTESSGQVALELDSGTKPSISYGFTDDPGKQPGMELLDSHLLQ